ncbi:MAG: type II toxin-antitoxin system HipA family toxin [Holophagales bacterium]|nr:type II toxin-antitoxin system HipA family toxin [Holophagales bacterium]MYD20947.1 type II toxin-antitoxin system HipA family toxin [Holophagales bacterium]MYI33294.1 type II toxin-antitoxin system HipA family toxin [Holophagales bacterium]
MIDARVYLWGRRIGAVSWVTERNVGVFQYDPDFVPAGIGVSPLAMPARLLPYSFPALGEAFHGLPGLLADALPDDFGNRLIDVWLAEQGKRSEDFNPVDRLCYVGTRGVGALEFEPAISRGERNGEVELIRLVDLANWILDERRQLSGRLDEPEGLEDLLVVGTSAGGARAKAVLAWNKATNEFRSGQVNTGAGFEHWILKFDGVAGSSNRELAAPQGYGRIEYAYHLMALDAGIEMSECRLHHEGGRSHFMTRRFDRDTKGRKVHMQSLAALRHFDYRKAGANAYEQAMETIRRLGLGMAAVEEQFRRAVFNVAARNQDDHVKNIAFLMNRVGEWRLSPAYDVVYAYNPAGFWTGQHQMSLAGKRRGFERSDLLRFAETSGLKAPLANRVIDETLAAVADWPQFATEAGVGEGDARRIGRTHRLDLRSRKPWRR